MNSGVVCGIGGLLADDFATCDPGIACTDARIMDNMWRATAVSSYPAPLSSRTGLPIVALTTVALVALCGCGGGSQDRCDISGEVTLDGAPLASGAITLRPLRKGQTTGATIDDGQFAIVGEQAPKFGKYRVEIEAYLPTGKTIPDPDNPGAMADELKQVVPERYNRTSQLETEITPDSDGHLAFHLKSK